jgi:23S rRNA (cytosine1962-C5)-methyltransferase
LAAAAAGAEVVHVDAAKNVVDWARRNAALSGLEGAAIRWIAEDARKFVLRELKRGNRYDAVILDPPSYGHGAGGETWKLERDLLPLLQACGELTAERRAFMLLTCHSPNFGAAELQAVLADAVFGHCQSGATAKPLSLRTADGRKLASGMAARWPK